jgi:hypothetical protein
MCIPWLSMPYSIPNISATATWHTVATLLGMSMPAPTTRPCCPYQHCASLLLKYTGLDRKGGCNIGSRLRAFRHDLLHVQLGSCLCLSCRIICCYAMLYILWGWLPRCSYGLLSCYVIMVVQSRGSQLACTIHQQRVSTQAWEDRGHASHGPVPSEQLWSYQAHHCPLPRCLPDREHVSESSGCDVRGLQC